MGKREDILAATRDLIVEEGLQSLSFSKIFARAGVGSGTVYNYFASKETLVNALYHETVAVMDREVLLGYDPHASIKERFWVLMQNMIRFVLSYRKELAILDACCRSPSFAEELRLQLTPTMEIALSLFSEAQAAGVFRPMDQMVATMMTTGAILAVAQGHLDGKYSLDEAKIEQAITASWRALAAPEALS